MLHYFSYLHTYLTVVCCYCVVKVSKENLISLQTGKKLCSLHHSGLVSRIGSIAQILRLHILCVGDEEPVIQLTVNSSSTQGASFCVHKIFRFILSRTAILGTKEFYVMLKNIIYYHYLVTTTKMA